MRIALVVSLLAAFVCGAVLMLGAFVEESIGLGVVASIVIACVAWVALEWFEGKLRLR